LFSNEYFMRRRMHMREWTSKGSNTQTAERWPGCVCCWRRELNTPASSSTLFASVLLISLESLHRNVGSETLTHNAHSPKQQLAAGLPQAQTHALQIQNIFNMAMWIFTGREWFHFISYSQRSRSNHNHKKIAACFIPKQVFFTTAGTATLNYYTAADMLL
jgi:hypothetical protein